mgnify:CR=1 FL=1
MAGLGATQFALPGAKWTCSGRSAMRQIRSNSRFWRQPIQRTLTVHSQWPAFTGDRRQRAHPSGAVRRAPVGATVILVNGSLASYLARGDRQLLVFLPESEPSGRIQDEAVAWALIDRARGVTGNSEGDGGPLVASAARRNRWAVANSAPARLSPHRGRVHRRRNGISGAGFRPSQPEQRSIRSGSSPVPASLIRASVFSHAVGRTLIALPRPGPPSYNRSV